MKNFLSYTHLLKAAVLTAIAFNIINGCSVNKSKTNDAAVNNALPKGGKLIDEIGRAHV